MAPTSKIERIVEQLQQLYAEADKILDSHVDAVMRDRPPGTSFGATRFEVLHPAGRALDYVGALRLIQNQIVRPPARY